MTTHINIISGFLGAGKTTFLKKILPYMKGKIALIENEFGDIGIDGDLIQDDLPIKEIYAGCICCSVVQDLVIAIEELTLEHRPDHIFIEPSGVGSLSDIIKVCRGISKKVNIDIKINHLITIVDVSAFNDYLEDFGTFYLDQIQNANIIFLSCFDKIDHIEIEKIVTQIRIYNHEAVILKDDWYAYQGEEIISILNTIKSEIVSKEQSEGIPANKIFSSLSFADTKIFSQEELDILLSTLKDKKFGFIIRAKGFIELSTKQFAYFNFTPHHYHWEYIEGCRGAKVVVIGSNLNNIKILQRFQI